jgi:hypothetical protein
MVSLLFAPFGDTYTADMYAEYVSEPKKKRANILHSPWRACVPLEAQWDLHERKAYRRW